MGGGEQRRGERGRDANPKPPSGDVRLALVVPCWFKGRGFTQRINSSSDDIDNWHDGYSRPSISARLRPTSSTRAVRVA